MSPRAFFPPWFDFVHAFLVYALVARRLRLLFLPTHLAMHCTHLSLSLTLLFLLFALRPLRLDHLYITLRTVYAPHTATAMDILIHPRAPFPRIIAHTCMRSVHRYLTLFTYLPSFKSPRAPSLPI
ncbi:hypothetical protein B0H14DRAFT_2811043, partial [Mycena olivaceomarginata]